MRHYEQLSNQEVALALDLTEPAASMRYLCPSAASRAMLLDPSSSSPSSAESS